MGRKRKTGSHGARQLQQQSKKKEYTENTLLDPDSRGFIYDEVDNYNDIESDAVMTKARKMMKKKEESREQVLGIGGDSESDESEGEPSDSSHDENHSDDEFFMDDDDIVDAEQDELPDERDWGKKKKFYFGTDMNDEKIARNLYKDREDLKALEEETARRLQDRMANELEDLDQDDLLPQEEVPVKDQDTFTVDTDPSLLPIKKRLQILNEKSPEFLPLIKDFKEKSLELHTTLKPLMELVKKGAFPLESAAAFVSTKFQLVFNHLCTVSAYIMMKCSDEVPRNHPVLSRLVQYRQLLKELEPCEEALMPYLLKILAASRKKELKVLKQSNKRRGDSLKPLAILKKARLQQRTEHVEREDYEVDSDVDKEMEEVDTDTVERRAINYEIAKNKGLMPTRTKEQRNPRVKYRKKYQNKLKRRKGQVKMVRKELKKYDGEVSGIKSNVIKSVKIK
ncbi:UTP3 small subunit processome component Sas10 [Oratosquilla oratoria]|uniref:UTP3 small subunit processome component Sas10 n=1 Tax=Oratosquilla oratoria TaxID=337810 RepID=UPI003F7742F8